MGKWIRAALMVGMAWIALSTGQSAATAAEVNVVEYGQYALVDNSAPPLDDNLRMVVRGDLIPAITGTNFYIGYRLADSFTTPQAIEEVVLWYPTGVENPATPGNFEVSRRAKQARPGQLHRAGWGLTEGEYIAPGIWTVQLWHGTTLLYGKIFNIALP